MTTVLFPQDIVDRSLRVITDGQASSGAYIASPNFPQYHFAWLRDGAYCALAMDASGGDESAAAFHDWAARVVEKQSDRIGPLIRRLESGEIPDGQDMLPTRYTLEGEMEHVEGEAWPNFQLDGYGTWLFALYSHFGADFPLRLLPAAELVADYLVASWKLPCFDYWEEFGERRHTSTLAAIAAGLKAASRLLDRPELDRVAGEIVSDILENCVVDGVLGKGPDDARVDASLVSLATPFSLLDPVHPVMAATIERIRTDLSSSTGGIRRYLGDTYFGGNPWLLLTAWLGWHDRLTGNEQGHASARNWVLDNASIGGALAEQILHEPQDAAFVGPWLERWGPVANPLLWSHAEFLLMESEARAMTWS